MVAMDEIRQVQIWLSPKIQITAVESQAALERESVENVSICKVVYKKWQEWINFKRGWICLISAKDIRYS